MNQRTDKIITIIGGTGFLGRYVTELLTARGYQVRVIARDTEVDFRVKTSGDVGQVKMVLALTKSDGLAAYCQSAFLPT